MYNMKDVWQAVSEECVTTYIQYRQLEDLPAEALQITEIFNILNYGIHFFVYCLTGTLFRAQLEYSFRIRFMSNNSGV